MFGSGHIKQFSSSNINISAEWIGCTKAASVLDTGGFPFRHLMTGCCVLFPRVAINILKSSRLSNSREWKSYDDDKKYERREIEGMVFIVTALVFLRGSEVMVEIVDGWMVTGTILRTTVS